VFLRAQNQGQSPDGIPAMPWVNVAEDSLVCLIESCGEVGEFLADLSDAAALGQDLKLASRIAEPVA